MKTVILNNGVTMPIGSFEVWTYTSVTINGAFMPNALQCDDNSEMRPAPNFTAVG